MCTVSSVACGGCDSAESAAAPPADVAVTVEDTGSGFGDNDPDHIFETFFTTKEDGMGMGLSISRSIVQAHGGRRPSASRRRSCLRRVARMLRRLRRAMRPWKPGRWAQRSDARRATTVMSSANSQAESRSGRRHTAFRKKKFHRARRYSDERSGPRRRPNTARLRRSPRRSGGSAMRACAKATQRKLYARCLSPSDRERPASASRGSACRSAVPARRQ